MDSAEFLGLPARVAKPRHVGLTHVMDKGLGLDAIRSMVEMSGDYIDIVKLGWGTSYVTGMLREKLDLYKALDIPVVCGGTLLEVAEARGRIDGYRQWLSDQGFARTQARAHRAVRQGLPRPQRGRLQGRRRDFRALPVGPVDQGRARCRLLEGDHRGPRIGYRRHLPHLR